MKTQLLGALLLAVLLVSRAGTATEDQSQKPSLPPNRFQIFFSPHARADMFLIDGWTGKTWQWAVFSDLKGKPHAWEPTLRFESEADVLKWMATMPAEPAGVR